MGLGASRVGLLRADYWVDFWVVFVVNSYVHFEGGYGWTDCGGVRGI